MLIKKMVSSTKHKSGFLGSIIILIIFIIGCNNLSQARSLGSHDRLSPFQGVQGINTHMISQQKFTAVSSVRIVLPKDAGQVLKHIASVFTRQVQQRCNAKVTESSKAALTIELLIKPGIGSEGFKIVDDKSWTIQIIGNDERGILYGIGKFLRTSRYDQGGFTAGRWRGTSIPQNPVRGIYLATHFHNFYDIAPMEEMQHYVEDIALWGYNVLLLWYPMDVFNGFDDPAAVRYRVRLHGILNAARAIGMDVAWGEIGNGGYHNSPDSIRAVKFLDHGAQIASDVCPSAPGGTEYILENTRQLLVEFSDVRPKYYFIWPYDNGGCDSKDCRPWGTNGFLRMAKLMAEQQRKYIPESKTILSTWLFSPSEWTGILKKFSDDPPEWVNYTMNEWLSDGTRPVGSPGGKPQLGFPEITMLSWNPWGGYGATPLPERFQAEWRGRSHSLSGGFPYSEGIYDDINKALIAQFYWQPDRSAKDILKEYISFEYSPDIVADITKAIEILEFNHYTKPHGANVTYSTVGILKQYHNIGEINQNAEEAFKLIQKSEQKMTIQAKQAWRWRILALRALIDRELYRTNPQPVFERKVQTGQATATIPGGNIMNEAFRELETIYHGDTTNPETFWNLPPLVHYK